MKKILAIVLMTALLVCPVFASGEAMVQAPAAAPAAAPVVTPEPACNHAFTVEKTVEETCTEKGLLTYACSKCDLSYTVEVLPTGHDASAAAATCDQDVVCLNCGVVLEAATGHAYTYQMDAEQAEDGSFVTFGTWACDNCGDVIDATEGNAVYYYAEAEAEAASAEPSAEASEEASAEAEPAAAPANPNYDPAAYNWTQICLILAIVVVVVGAVLMLSFGKKKKD